MNRDGASGLVVLTEPGYVTVQMERKHACSNCNGCAAGILGTEMRIKARNLCGADVNDKVVVELANEHFLLAVTVLYGLPLIFLLLGFTGGYLTWKTFVMEKGREIVGFLTGLFFMLVSYYLIKRNQKVFDKEKYIPQATQRIKD